MYMYMDVVDKEESVMCTVHACSHQRRGNGRKGTAERLTSTGYISGPEHDGKEQRRV